MSDPFTDTMPDDRGSLLDRFAESSRDEQRNNGQAMIPAQHFAPTGERIIGAQNVAVRRDGNRVLARLRTLGAAAGEEWYYRFPVKNRRENRTDWIEGPSIKLANDLAREFGNCDVDVRVTDLGDTWLFYARFTDFETGFSMARPFQQRKSGSKLGGDDDSRRLDIALQIGASKAIRNVIVNSLQTYADFAFAEAKRALVDRIGKDLAAWRSRTIDRLEEHVALARVERVIGRPSGEWMAPDVARVIAMMKGIADGMASVDDTFPPIEEPTTGKDASADLDKFAGEGKEATGQTRKRRATKAAAAPAEQAEGEATDHRNSQADTGPADDHRNSQAGAGDIPAHLDRRQPRAPDGSKDTPGVPATGTRGPGDSSALEVIAELVAACERADTIDKLDAVSVAFRDRIKALGNDDRLDVSQIGQTYSKWRRGEIDEAELTEEVGRRRQLVAAQAR